MDPERALTTGNRRHFVTTRWSLVIAAGSESSVRDDAVARLCEAYWYPLYGHLRSRGYDAADAEDLVQAFFLRVLQKGALRQADPARGRFRSFMVSSLKHFASNERDRALSGKRGGHTPVLSLDVAAAERRLLLEPASADTPETIFNRRWALTLLEQVLARLQGEMHASGHERQFEWLKPYLTGEEPQLSYETTAARLGISEGAVKVAVHRLRRRFREMVRDEVAQTVASAEEVDDELRYLRSVVKT
jgi:RNA polymerase sigma factor (sigma-70 family)